MTNAPRWPLTRSATTTEVSANEAQWQLARFVFDDDDPLRTYEFAPLVYPRPLVDKALLGRDDEEVSDD